MPTASADALLHQTQISARCWRLRPFVSSLIAGPASGNDILCRIDATVLPCVKVLCGALKSLRLRRLYLVGSGKSDKIILPHRQAAIVAAAQLSKVSGFSIAD